MKMRNGEIFIIVGGRGTGKTTFLEKTLSKCADSTTVVELFITDRYKGFSYRKLYDDIQLKDCVNTKLILEDSTQLIAANGTKLVRQLVVSSKQLGSDVFLVFHSFNFIPPFLWAMFDKLVVFDCEPIIKRPHNLPYYDKILELQRKNTKQYAVKGVVVQC